MAVQPAIFIVDDDAGTREFVRALLSGASVSAVKRAAGFDEASLCDGMSCCSRYACPTPMVNRATRPETGAAPRGVIMMTARAEVPTVVKAMQAGARTSSEAVLQRCWSEACSAPPARVEAGPRRSAVRRYAARLDTLTGRERDVFDRLVQGWLNKVVALI
jgi:FixJ family two-component response regulator